MRRVIWLDAHNKNQKEEMELSILAVLADKDSASNLSRDL